MTHQIKQITLSLFNVLPFDKFLFFLSSFRSRSLIEFFDAKRTIISVLIQVIFSTRDDEEVYGCPIENET